MRTTQRETGAIVFAIRTVDAASGSGLAQPGNIPYTFVRSATGVYSYNFNPAIVPLAVTVSVAQSATLVAGVSATLSPGGFTVQTNQATTGTPTNGYHALVCTAMDRRL